MREVQLKWNADSILSSDMGLITQVAAVFEVVAHLEVTKIGVRQLVKITFKEGMGPKDLNEISYLEVEGPLNPYPLPEVGKQGDIGIPIVESNTDHKISKIFYSFL